MYLTWNKTARGLEAQVPHTRGPAVLMFLSLHDVNIRPFGRQNADKLHSAIRTPRPGRARRREMVGRDGLEPSTLRLSGVRSNHLSYRPISGRACLPQPLPRREPQALNLPDLPESGGAYRDRTDDPLLAKQMLSQLS